MDPRSEEVSGSSPPLLLAAEVSTLASAAGFDLCGFARADPIPAATLVEWLEAGMAADMDWMALRTAERLDVTKLLPGALTVVALACNYHFPDGPAPPSPIARYARGRDYHYTLRDRLRALRRELRARHPEVKTFSSVDTGPMMEKVWASRAGLGYVGRNGCLITEEFGSYVLLATMVLDSPVDHYAGGPAMDRCGSCSLCVSACPTQAIVADATIDATRCLSYQTIENRGGDVPEPLRPAFQNLVFGCDICQDVCPLNRHPVNAGPRFVPRAVASLGVREIAALTREQYGELVPGTPLARAQFDGLRRNAAYALGAARALDAQVLLETLCNDGSEPVRHAAQWALTQLSLPAS